jgi:hypothetical protein
LSLNDPRLHSAAWAAEVGLGFQAAGSAEDIRAVAEDIQVEGAVDIQVEGAVTRKAVMAVAIQMPDRTATRRSTNR